MSEISVEELRRGLFCILWKLNTKDSKDFSEEKVIELCGSQEGQKITITFNQNSKKESRDSSSCKYHYTVIVEETSWKNLTHEEDSKFDPDSEIVQEMLLVRSQMRKENQKSFLNYKVPDLSKLYKSQLSCPVYIWLKSIFKGKKDVALKKVDSFKWEKGCSVDKRRDYVTLYVDFGTTKMSERNVITGLADMFNNQHRCDVLFQFKNGQTIGAHILILSAGSPVFAAVFQSGVLESQPRRMTITDVEFNVFHQILIYLYSGSTPQLEKEEEEFTELMYDAADKYNIQPLKMECIDVLLKKVDITNAISMLIWSHSRFVPKLFTFAMETLAKNSRDIFLRPEWLDFMRNYPELCVLVTKNMVV